MGFSGGVWFRGFTVLQVLGSLELKLSSYWGCWALGFETETRLQEFGLRVLVGFRVGSTAGF